MKKVTIHISDELWRRVKANRHVNVSRVCQDALATYVNRVDPERQRKHAERIKLLIAATQGKPTLLTPEEATRIERRQSIRAICREQWAGLSVDEKIAIREASIRLRDDFEMRDIVAARWAQEGVH